MTTITENYEKTEQLAFPEVYTFITGDERTYYTSWHENITIDQLTYLARPIKRSGFKQDTQMGKVIIDVTASILPEFARYIANTPIEPTRIKIVRLVETDYTQYVTIFDGDILAVTFQDYTASARCEAFSSLLNIILPREVCKPTCNHILFDTRCGLHQPDYTVPGTVLNITGGVIDVSGIESSGYIFSGGFVKFGQDFRLITKQDGDALALHVPFYNLQVGDSVNVVPGCDGAKDTCINVYNNFDSFLGMTSIPTKNPCVYGA